MLAGFFILYTLPPDLILTQSGCLLSPPQFLRAFGVLGEVCRGQICEWSKVTGRVLWGSGLMPVLFDTFVNRLEREINSEVTKFAADAELPEW